MRENPTHLYLTCSNMFTINYSASHYISYLQIMTEDDQTDSPGGGQSEISEELLRQLRLLVTTYQEAGQWESAIYWADKVTYQSEVLANQN